MAHVGATQQHSGARQVFGNSDGSLFDMGNGMTSMTNSKVARQNYGIALMQN